MVKRSTIVVTLKENYVPLLSEQVFRHLPGRKWDTDKRYPQWYLHHTFCDLQLYLGLQKKHTYLPVAMNKNLLYLQCQTVTCIAPIHVWFLGQFHMFAKGSLNYLTVSSIVIERFFLFASLNRSVLKVISLKLKFHWNFCQTFPNMWSSIHAEMKIKNGGPHANYWNMMDANRIFAVNLHMHAWS